MDVGLCFLRFCFRTLLVFGVLFEFGGFVASLVTAGLGVLLVAVCVGWFVCDYYCGWDLVDLWVWLVWLCGLGFWFCSDVLWCILLLGLF